MWVLTCVDVVLMHVDVGRGLCVDIYVYVATDVHIDINTTGGTDR